MQPTGSKSHFESPENPKAKISTIKTMVYKNRKEAGKILAKNLLRYKSVKGIVLAIPSGGIPIGRIIADYLNLPLEPFLSKKIGHPNNKEYAIGSVTLSDMEIDEKETGIDEEYLRTETANIRKTLQEKQARFLHGKTPSDLKNLTVILVDDGIATGHTVISAIRSIRKAAPARIVVAAPVSAPSSAARVKALADDFICPVIPRDFISVGQYFETFEQLSEQDVMEELKQTEHTV